MTIALKNNTLHAQRQCLANLIARVGRSWRRWPLCALTVRALPPGGVERRQNQRNRDAGISGEIVNRVGDAWIASLRLGRDAVDLAEGRFTANILGARVAWSFTPRVFLQALAQYNSQTKRVGINVRFGWLNTAGTGLFVVYNDTQRTADPREAVARALIVKLTRQFDTAW